MNFGAVFVLAGLLCLAGVTMPFCLLIIAMLVLLFDSC